MIGWKDRVHRERAKSKDYAPIRGIRGHPLQPVGPVRAIRRRCHPQQPPNCPGSSPVQTLIAAHSKTCGGQWGSGGTGDVRAPGLCMIFCGCLSGDIIPGHTRVISAAASRACGTMLVRYRLDIPFWVASSGGAATASGPCESVKLARISAAPLHLPCIYPIRPSPVSRLCAEENSTSCPSLVLATIPIS